MPLATRTKPTDYRQNRKLDEIKGLLQRIVELLELLSKEHE
jgi:hypothetical protein